MNRLQRFSTPVAHQYTRIVGKRKADVTSLPINRRLYKYVHGSFFHPFADTALVIIKCHAMRDGETILNVNAMDMDVVEVVRLG